MDVYKRLEELNVKLPKAVATGGVYTPVKQVGKLLYVSGCGTAIEGEGIITGKVGAERTVEEGQKASVRCVRNALSRLEEYLSDLNKIKGVVKILGFIASAPDFCEQPKVLNGASQLLRDIWGESGLAARSAIGTNALPSNYTVEVEFIFEIE